MRSAYLRTALAVLALLGQLTPAVALPVASSARLLPARPAACAATGSASCACPTVLQAAAACCCAEPKPAEPPKPQKASCCDLPDAPKKAKSCCDALPPKPLPAKPPAVEGGPRIVAGGKCKCDKPAPLVNVEPAAPHTECELIEFTLESQPGVCLWAARESADSQPPPSPPPRSST